MKRINYSRITKRININNLKYVYRMKWSEKQIQFIKIQATPKYVNNNNFFVKIKNYMVFVKNKGKFKKNLNFFKKFKKFKNYNIKKKNQNFSGNLPNQLNNKNNINNGIKQKKQILIEHIIQKEYLEIKKDLIKIDLIKDKNFIIIKE